MIQTQPGPEGSTVALNRAAVTGDVLTVQLSYTNNENACCQRIRADEVSVIDDATAQQIGVLKDNSGKSLASPLESGWLDRLHFDLDRDAPTIVWSKFPAPPPTSRTVSINVPNVAPVDGVPITR